ncbi:MAG: hypothetical protein ACO2PM_14255 [Pyrobaculum sp.]
MRIVFYIDGDMSAAGFHLADDPSVEMLSHLLRRYGYRDQKLGIYL